MDCIQSLQKSIDFMEKHLLEKTSYEDVAKHLFMSPYHFHRLFSMISGITPAEYLRNRRLSMAGQELIMSQKKVIDIALKYGYESPESFTKAFTRFHGVTPNAAKDSGILLQSFNRLNIKINLEGGTAMEYKILEKEGFKLLAKVRAFPNESVSEEGNTRIPDFWRECHENGVFDVLNEHTKTRDTYGVCAPTSKATTHFDYGIGRLYEGGSVPEGFCVLDVTPTLWAVFKCIGENPDCIGDTWNRIFKEFLPGSDYNIQESFDFELYPENGNPGCFCEIWIPVEKK